MEIWLTCEDCPDYEVSNFGDVRSKDRFVVRSDTNSIVYYSSRPIAQNLDNCGYLRIRVSVNKEKKSFKVHRLVAKAFIDNPENKPQVNHLDGDKKNNRVGNLEWVNNSENQNHAIEIGLKEIQSGEQSKAFKCRVKVLDMQGNFLYYLSGNKQMKDAGFDFRLVNAVCLGKRNSHKGHKFKKENINEPKL